MMASSSSSNLSDHLLQDDLPWPSLPFVPTLHHTIGANHQWSQPLMLNCSDHFTSDELEVLLTAQGHHHSQSSAPTFPQLSSVLMMQELGFQWSNRAVADASMTMLISQQDSHKIKAGEELPAESLNSPRSSCGTTIAYNDIADGAGLPLAALDGVVLPSVNVSRLQKPCPAAPLLPGDAFEILASARLCKTLLSQASSVLHNGMPLLREHVPYGPPDLLQGPSIDNYKMGLALASVDNPAEGRGGGGHGSTAEHKAAACQHGALLVPSSSSSKKPRLESQSRSSTIVPSFKVRKEKLGDRIAALQQLVSPFGKTDTASVLMEAIGYIKFLQDQVETLSGPYMRSSKNKKARRTQQRGSSANGGENKQEGANNKLDLRSRGLCLVPLSCTSYVTNENGVWAPPPNFRGN